MSVYLYQLQHKHVHQLLTGQRDQIQEINDVLHSLGVQVYKIGRRLTPNEKANMEEVSKCYSEVKMYISMSAVA